MKSKVFDKVILINLPERKDRLNAWYEQNGAELSFHEIIRIDGVDARRMEIDKAFGSSKTCWSQGQIGCVMAHIVALEMAARNVDQTLITEDDAHFLPDFVANLRDTLPSLPGGFYDVIMFGGNGKSEECSTHAYVVTPEGARKILREMPSAGALHYDLILFALERKRRISILRIPGLTKNSNRAPMSNTALNFIFERNNLTPSQIASMQFSQYEEDAVIYDYFRRLWPHETHPNKKKRFLEIGAMDGKQFSNCWKLALMGWGGVCIEPNPFLYGRLHKNYMGAPEIQTLCSCVGPDFGIRTLHLNDDGLSTTDADIFEGLRERVTFYGHCFAPTVTPDCVAQIFGNNFDFVSIDAEGMDMAIVESGAKLLENTIMLCVETDRPGHGPEDWYREKWKEVLNKAGFTKVHHQTVGNTILLRE